MDMTGKRCQLHTFDSTGCFRLIIAFQTLMSECMATSKYSVWWVQTPILFLQFVDVVTSKFLWDKNVVCNVIFRLTISGCFVKISAIKSRNSEI